MLHYAHYYITAIDMLRLPRLFTCLLPFTLGSHAAATYAITDALMRAAAFS